MTLQPDSTSIWEECHFQDFDVIIVGGGLTGVNIGLSLLEQSQLPGNGILPNPRLKVAILERNLFPNGASTKNAGFTVFTEFTEFLDDIEQMGEKKTVEISLQRFKGVQILMNRMRKLFGESEISRFEVFWIIFLFWNYYGKKFEES